MKAMNVQKVHACRTVCGVFLVTILVICMGVMTVKIVVIVSDAVISEVSHFMSIIYRFLKRNSEKKHKKYYDEISLRY